MTKDQINQDFKLKVNELIEKRFFRNQKELVDKLGWSVTSMSASLAGTRGVPQDIYVALINIYKEKTGQVADEQALYIVQSAEREEYKDKYIAALEQTRDLQSILIDDMEERIKLLEEQVTALKRKSGS